MKKDINTVDNKETQDIRISKDRMMLYRLSLLPGFGSVTIRRLYELYAPFGDTLYIEESRLKKEAGLNEKQLAGIRNLGITHKDAVKSYDRLTKEGIRVITFIDEDFPERLKNIPQSPAVLYVKGSLPPDDTPSVAIVGSRNATNYGISMAQFLAERLAKEGISIVSGMALGIDGAAHRGALSYEFGKTYAVLGSGVNVCYPKENFPIYDALCDGKRGGIISEVPPGESPARVNFPLRNRIISGLSDLVIIAEAREKSGSGITAGFALEQNRDVMAVPGRITDPMSRGCNSLIYSGAAIVRSPEDVLDLLNMTSKGKFEIPDKNIKLLAKTEKVVYSTLDLQPKYISQIAEETGLSDERVSMTLLGLELKGYVTQYSAGYYGIQ